MLKLTDTGVEIRLTGTPAPNYALVFAGLLGVLALVVAYLAITQAVAIAIGGIFVLAVGCFCFNLYKEKLKNQPICGGTLIAQAGQLDLNGQLIKLSPTTKIEINNNLFTIQDKKNAWHIGGFDNEKEMAVLKAVLQGEQIGGRAVAIKMGQSTPQ